MTNEDTEKIFDWMGNEVKAGMTIYFVQTKPSFLETARIGWVIPITGVNIWEDEKEWEKRKNRDVWELGREYDVVNIRGGLQVRMNIEDNEDIESIIFPICYMFGENPTIAIKGISDTTPIKTES